MPNKRKISVGLEGDSDVDALYQDFEEITPNVLEVATTDLSISGFFGEDCIVREFTPVTEIWARVEFVDSVAAGHPILQLCPNESYVDRAWWTGADTPAGSPQFAMLQTASIRRVMGWNDAAFFSGYTDYGVSGPGKIYDMYAHLIGTGFNTWDGHNNPVTTWHLESWQDGVKAAEINWQLYVQYNIFPPSGQYFTEGISAMVLVDPYASGIGSPGDIIHHLTNFSAGTSQGADDILANEDFASGDLGSFTYLPGGNTTDDPSHSFRVVPHP